MNEFIIKNGFISKDNSQIVGSLTATTYYGDGSNLIGVSGGFTGGTVTGATNFTSGLSANTISATTISGGTLYGDGSNLTGIVAHTTYTGGTTFTGITVNGNLTVTGTTSSGVISATTYQNLPTDIRVTGGTYSNGTATFTNNTGGTFNVTGFVSADTYVTGVTYTANTLTVSRNQGLSNLTATIGLNIKSGSVASGSFAGTPRTAAVTFTTAYPNTNYSITITGGNNRNYTYQSKATTGFTINTNANTALTADVDWQTIQYGES